MVSEADYAAFREWVRPSLFCDTRKNNELAEGQHIGHSKRYACP